MTNLLLYKTPISLASVFLLSGCLSPDYNCPLHDKPRACLSQLQAYKLAQNPMPSAQQDQPSLYSVKPIRPHYTQKKPQPQSQLQPQTQPHTNNHPANNFSWYGNME